MYKTCVDESASCFASELKMATSSRSQPPGEMLIMHHINTFITHSSIGYVDFLCLRNMSLPGGRIPVLTAVGGSNRGDALHPCRSSSPTVGNTTGLRLGPQQAPS